MRCIIVGVRQIANRDSRRVPRGRLRRRGLWSRVSLVRGWYLMLQPWWTKAPACRFPMPRGLAYDPA